MAPHRGFGGSIGFGTEAGWGAGATRTNWLRASSLGMRRTRDKQPIGHLGSYGQASSMNRDFYVASDFAGGPVSVPMAYNDSTCYLLKHIFGAVAEGGGGGPDYTHTFTLASPLSASMAVEQIKGTSGGSGDTAELFSGGLVNSAKIYVESGRPMMCDLDLMAQTSGGIVAAGTPTYNTTRQYVLHNHADTLTLGGTAFVMRSLAFTISRNLERNHELGSLLTSVPVEGGLEVEIEASVLWQVDTWHDRYLDDTQGDLVASFAYSGALSMAFTAQNCLIIDCSEPTNAKGGILQTIKLRPFADTTDQGLTCVVTNQNSVYTTN